MGNVETAIVIHHLIESWINENENDVERMITCIEKCPSTLEHFYTILAGRNCFDLLSLLNRHYNLLTFIECNITFDNSYFCCLPEYAAITGRVDIFKLLFEIEIPVDYQIKNNTGEGFCSMLALTTKAGNVDAAKFLIESGADPNSMINFDGSGTSNIPTFVSAIISQSIPMVDLYLSHGVDFNNIYAVRSMLQYDKSIIYHLIDVHALRDVTIIYLENVSVHPRT